MPYYYAQIPAPEGKDPNIVNSAGQTGYLMTYSLAPNGVPAAWYRNSDDAMFAFGVTSYPIPNGSYDKITVDTNYSPDSENAQAGTAVAQAMAQFKTNYFDTAVTTTGNNATNAANSANAAAQSATAAANSAEAAAISANSISGMVNAAAASAANATASANAATAKAASANEARDQAIAAANSASASANTAIEKADSAAESAASANAAKTAAESAASTAIENATISSTNADIAVSAATTASTLLEEVKVNAADALLASTETYTYMEAARISELNASTYMETANEYANQAQQYKTTASTFATAAGESAESASSSATAAEAAATTASTLLGKVKESASAVAINLETTNQNVITTSTYLQTSKTYAETATTQATLASNSATSASASANAAAASASATSATANTAMNYVTSTFAATNQVYEDAIAVYNSTVAAYDSTRVLKAEIQVIQAAFDSSTEFFQEHVDNSTVHLTGNEHKHLNQLFERFPEIDDDTPPVITPDLPSEALSWAVIQNHLSLKAAPGVTEAPGKVYATRTPWARLAKNEEVDGTLINNQWVNNATILPISEGIAPRKFMDNAPGGVMLQHQCITYNTVNVVDDYVGKEWAFYWQHCNFVEDEYGNKHITAINGELLNGELLNGVAFSYTEKNVGAFGPKFWFACKYEMYQDPESGVYNTIDGVGVHKQEDGSYLTTNGEVVTYDAASCQFLKEDGTPTGTPLYQLWIISDRAWDDLDDNHKEILTNHGIYKDDLHIWPECMIWDNDSQAMVERPYWIHSAFCGGFEENDEGVKSLVSKKNAPLWHTLSYETFLQKLRGSVAASTGFGGTAIVNAHGALFDIVKNAQRSSQVLHTGVNTHMGYNNDMAHVATYSTLDPGYIFPLAAAGKLKVGSTVRLSNAAANASTGISKRGKGLQYGRVVKIENTTFFDADGVEQTALCLHIDPDSVQSPFYVRTTAAETDALTEGDSYACCYASQMFCMGGETLMLKGKTDGAMWNDGYHGYRVQGTEFMMGTLIIAADVVAIKGNGTTAVTVDGVTSIPTSSYYIYLQAGQRTGRLARNSLAEFLNAGYTPIAIVPAVTGWINNAHITPSGVLCPLSLGGTGSSSANGHGDYQYSNQTRAEFIMGGSGWDGLNGAGAYGGSAFLSFYWDVAGSNWGVGARV